MSTPFASDTKQSMLAWLPHIFVTARQEGGAVGQDADSPADEEIGRYWKMPGLADFLKLPPIWQFLLRARRDAILARIEQRIESAVNTPDEQPSPPRITVRCEEAGISDQSLEDSPLQRVRQIPLGSLDPREAAPRSSPRLACGATA